MARMWKLLRSRRPDVAAKTLTEIRSIARGHTRTAIRVLVGIMCSEDATPAARVSAANAILDRGWGKATQPVANSDDGAFELIHRIERVIVHPEIASEEIEFLNRALGSERIERAPSG
jgi:hypothetical protein